jgi:DNA polymerase III delta prime subunit
MIKKLKKIAGDEKREISEDALHQISMLSEGTMLSK